MNPFKWLSRKSSAVGPIIYRATRFSAQWTKRDYAHMAKEAYVRNAIAYRCVRLIADGAATVPWMLQRDGEAIDAHPVLDLMARPTPIAGGEQLISQTVSYLMLSGNAYIEANGPAGKPPTELWPLRPDRMTINPGTLGLPEAYVYQIGGDKRTWEVDQITGQSDVLHVREFHPTDDWYGLAPVEPAGDAIDRNTASGAHNKALLDNGARPSGALIFEPQTSDGQSVMPPEETIKAAERALSEGHSGPENAGRTFVFGGNVKWEDMSTSPKDMDFAVSKSDAARDICTAFGVPHILLVPGQSTYNNVREAKLELFEETVIPIVRRLIGEFNHWLLPRYGEGLKFTPDLDSVIALEPRREVRRNSIAGLLEKGVIDADEARGELDYGDRSADAVSRVDAGVLTALMAGVDSFGMTPLVRYMRSVGLVAPDATEAEISDAALAAIEANTGGQNGM